MDQPARRPPRPAGKSVARSHYFPGSDNPLFSPRVGAKRLISPPRPRFGFRGVEARFMNHAPGARYLQTHFGFKRIYARGKGGGEIKGQALTFDYPERLAY